MNVLPVIVGVLNFDPLGRPDDLSLGEKHVRRKNFKKALEYFEHYISQAEEISEADCGRLNKAFNYIIASAKDRKTILTSRWLAAEAWRKAGHRELALTLYQSLYTVDPKNALCLLRQGQIYESFFEREKAIEYYQKTIGIAVQNKTPQNVKAALIAAERIRDNIEVLRILKEFKKKN